MRSISLALALVGAVIGGGCSGSSKPAPTPTPTPTTAAHGDISSPADHAPMYFAFARGAAGATDCTSCHGASLTGSTAAPGCTQCHVMPSLHPVFTSSALHGQAYLDYVAQKNGALDCRQCHGDTLQGKWGTPSCMSCHDEMPNTSSGAHFDVTAAAWGTHDGSNWSQACERCHTNQGYQDYVGVDGTANYLSGTFNVTNVLASDTSPDAYTHGPLQCQTCHNSVTDPLSTSGITNIVFPSLERVTTDTSTAICGQCHQARESTASMSTKLTASVASADQGLGVVSVSASADGTTTTLVKSGFTDHAYKGYTALFTGNKTAHNGETVTVTDNDATTITFSPALAAATVNGETVSLFPTATSGGTTTKLVDANRAWTASSCSGTPAVCTGGYVGFNVYFQTGNNSGLYRAIASNDATSLTLTDALPSAPSAGDRYQIVPKEDTTVLDAQLASSNSFTNSHYLGAAAQMFGADAAGLYQYPRNVAAAATRYAAYTGTNHHGVIAGRCTSCHNPHTLEITVTASTCGRCHFKTDGAPVSNMTELEETRQFGFEGDIDGLGSESLKTAIDNLAAKLYEVVRSYATNVAGFSICYTGASYPYLFLDNGAGGGTAGDGVCQAGEATNANAFKKFTPRLLRAMYNYHFYQKAPGGWAHNPRYMIEVLYDAIVDLNAGLVAKGSPAVAFSGKRAFNGHFGAAEDGANGGDQFRDWDGSVVPKDCSQCHGGAKGMDNYLADPWTTTTNRPVNGMQCTTCHAPLPTDTDMKRIRTIASVRFPPRSSNDASGQQAPIVQPASAFATPDDVMCSTCHTARESKASIDYKIGSKQPLDFSLGFLNPHYLGAASIVFGTDVKMMYEYSSKTYVGTKLVNGKAASCVACHQPKASRHTFEADATALGLDTTRRTAVQTLAAALLARLNVYATDNSAPSGAICYNGDAYPYWYKATSHPGGQCTGTEGGGYGSTFDSRMLKAAYNYQWSQKEPGAWAHNYEYITEVLIDSIQDLGGDVSGYTRP
jgi:hypothetical protein